MLKRSVQVAALDAPIPGPLSRALYEEEQHYISPGLQRIAQLSQLTLREGHGCAHIGTQISARQDGV